MTEYVTPEQQRKINETLAGVEQLIIDQECPEVGDEFAIGDATGIVREIAGDRIVIDVKIPVDSVVIEIQKGPLLRRD